MLLSLLWSVSHNNKRVSWLRVFDFPMLGEWSASVYWVSAITDDWWMSCFKNSTWFSWRWGTGAAVRWLNFQNVFIWMWKLTPFLNIDSKIFYSVRAFVIFLLQTPGYMKTIKLSSCLCPYPTNLALLLLCAVKALSWGKHPSELIYGPLLLNSRPAVRRSEKLHPVMEINFYLSCSLPQKLSSPSRGCRRLSLSEWLVKAISNTLQELS